MSARRTLFVTSALPYANGEIHLGKLLEETQADVWVRFQRLRGHKVVFVSADDVHGSPMMLKAEQLGITPEALAEQLHVPHRSDFEDFLVSHDLYYTTHSEENRELSEEIFRRLQANGYVYAEAVEQYFDPEKGMFLADRFLKGECPRCGAADQYGDNCEVCGATYEATELKHPRSVLSGAVPELRSSEHYFFDLPKLQDFLERWTASGTLQPAVENKIREWLDAGLQPWDISRDAPYFGFRIPGTEDKYFYVWVDAPVGYMAALKKLSKDDPEIDFDAIWSADSEAEVHHFIGKDIVNFHTLFWPAMLHASGFRTPTRVHVHGFLSVDGARMSKTRGTFINARTYLEHLDPEYLRYYFVTKLSPAVDDMDLSLDDFVARVNADLVGKVVNIASRCAGFVHKLAEGRLAAQCVEPDLWNDAVALGDTLAELYEAGESGKAVREIMALADRVNQYIDAAQPWVAAKEPGREAEVVATCTVGINLFRVLMVYLKPILPRMAQDAEAFLACDALTWANRGDWLGDHTIERFKALKTRVDRKTVDKLVAASREPEPAAAESPAVASGGDAREREEASGAPQIDIDTFSQVDLRVARIDSAETVDGADRLLRLGLDVGPLGSRTVFAGIRSAYDPAALEGRLVVLVANLAPRKMRFGVSEGMVLAAGPGGEDLFLLSPDNGAVPGMEVR